MILSKESSDNRVIARQKIERNMLSLLNALSLLFRIDGYTGNCAIRPRSNLKNERRALILNVFDSVSTVFTGIENKLYIYTVYFEGACLLSL